MRLVYLAGWMWVAGGLAHAYQAPQVAQAPASPPPATASIEGQVLNSATGTPLKKATVALDGMGGQAGPGGPGRGAQPARFSKETDDQGRFSFTALDAGRYSLSVTRPGFLRQSYGAKKYSGGGTPFILTADQHLRNVVFKLSPQSVI